MELPNTNEPAKEPVQEESKGPSALRTVRIVSERKQAAQAQEREIARKQAKIRSTKDYINYYQLIREKIRQRLKSHYGRQHGEGEVRLEFLLRADGALLAAGADRAASTQDAALVEIALKSLKEASPLPPFPKAVDLPRMSFDLTVVFKKE